MKSPYTRKQFDAHLADRLTGNGVARRFEESRQRWPFSRREPIIGLDNCGVQNPYRELSHQGKTISFCSLCREGMPDDNTETSSAKSDSAVR